MWTGVALLAVAQLCHMLAAIAIGGTFLAWRDHMVGFAGLALVSAGLLSLIGRRLWPRRSDVTMLLLGLTQLALGVWVYITRYSVHG
jgi:hypothetical protein